MRPSLCYGASPAGEAWCSGAINLHLASSLFSMNRELLLQRRLGSKGLHTKFVQRPGSSDLPTSGR